MNIKEAYAEYFEFFSKEIDKVLNGELQEVASEIYISPDEIDSYLKSKGLEQGDLDTNGWNYDFWMNYSKDDKYYTLMGSGWYARRITFSISED